MSLIAVVLLLISAATHAGWNLMGKREHPSVSFLLVANTLGCVCLVPLIIFFGRAFTAFPASVWFFLIFAGFCQAVYYSALAGAYRAGDLSIAYPLARSSPVIVVMIVTLILGRGDQVSRQCIFGIAMIMAGCFLLPMRQFSDFRFKNYWNTTCVMAMIAAFGTAGYSIIDDEALCHLRGAPGMFLGPSMATVLYAFVEGISSILWLSLFVMVQKQERGSLNQVLRHRKRWATLTGIGIYLTYTLVLISMAYVTNVSYVVAFRQISIPLGSILGVLILHEPRHMPKFIGTTIMFIGLMLVGTG